MGKVIKYKSLFIVFLLTALSFIVLFSFAFPIEYDNLGGKHSWLSGSTIKFVNNWLYEGKDLHFTSYENFNSIEFNDMNERSPYISYPTGEVFFVYIAARILGCNRIDISFLKHFQMICYGVEVLLFSGFIYIFLSGIGMKREWEKVAVSLSLAIMWISIPGNVWFMANVYFADQCVILWVMLFLFIEYLSGVVKGSRNRVFLKTVNLLIIYTGFLIDYYFWVVIFVAFVIQFISNYLSYGSFSKRVKESLWYICPVVFSIVSFIWQMSFTDNWMGILKEKFFQRTGMTGEYTIIYGLIRAFYTCFVRTGIDFWDMIRFVCMGVWFSFLLGMIVYCIWKNKLKPYLRDKNICIIAIGIISPIFQILLLRNHSAVHQFSMLKIGWVIVVSVLVLPLIFGVVFKVDYRKYFHIGKIKVSGFMMGYAISYITMILLLGMPFSIYSVYDFCYEEESYPLEEILYEVTDYEHVCFSFSYEIPVNPPQALSVSEKRVYKVDSLDEVESYFPNLNSAAKKLLIIDKNNKEINPKQLAVQEKLMERNKKLYEDDDYCILKLY